jgi:hypothetical protein
MIVLPRGPSLTLTFLAVVCLALAGLARVAAQDEPVELRSSADYVYGQMMNFNLSVTNVDDVEAVALFFRLGTSPDTFSVDVPLTAGPEINLTYPLDLTQTRLQPFSSVTYWWEIEREVGSPLRVPEQVLSYVDDQFVWRQLSTTDPQGGGSIRIHWTGDDEQVGELARDLTFEMTADVSRLIPLERIIPFDVYIYPSTSDLGAALRLAGRDYQPGQTYPDLGVVLATLVNPATAETELRAELSRGLVDLLLYQALGRSAYDLPPWLGRGLAGYVRGQRDVVLEDALRAAIVDDSSIAVADLCDGMAVEDDLAIAQSEALIAHIVENYGEAAVRDLVAAFAEGNNCAGALRRAIQLSPEQLQSSWLRASRSDQGSRAVAEIAVWLALVLAGFGLAALLLFRPRRMGS